MDPDERRRASTLLAAKADVADEGVPADASAAEEQREREVGDPAAATGQPQKRVALVHRLPDAPGAPVGIGFHGGIITRGCPGPSPPFARSGSGLWG
jgi:hypothetical protein